MTMTTTTARTTDDINNDHNDKDYNNDGDDQETN